MDFWNPHLQSPKALAPGPDYAPALAIYCDKDFILTVTSTQLQMTIGGGAVNVDYVGETIESLAERITTLGDAIEANALNQSHLLGTSDLLYSSERTPDEGHIVRFKGHIVRYTEETRIRPNLPYPDDRGRPWYPRVDRGTVWLRSNGIKFLFGVPEYTEQEWSSYFGAPFIDVLGVNATVREEKLIQVPFRPIFWYRENISISVNSIPTGANLIEDVDVHNGFIRLNAPVIRQDKISLAYTYREDGLIYKGVNLNPSPGHNPGIVDQTVLLYLVPEYSSIGGERKRTVRHIVGKTVIGAMTAIERTDEPVLIVGAYQVRPTTVLDDLAITDVRSFGGGVAPPRWSQATDKNREMHSLTDFGRYDGTPFPGAMSGVLKVPRSLLDTVDADHAEQLMKKHFASGGALLLEFTEDLE